MVRKYKRKTNSPEIPEGMRTVLTNVLRDMSIRVAASTFNIPKLTLYDFISNLRKRKSNRLFGQ